VEESYSSYVIRHTVNDDGVMRVTMPIYRKLVDKHCYNVYGKAPIIRYKVLVR